MIMKLKTIYLSAFNNTTITGQLRTMDPVTGMTTLITDWGFEQIAPFALPIWPCMSPVGLASNPNPPNGTTGVPIKWEHTYLDKWELYYQC